MALRDEILDESRTCAIVPSHWLSPRPVWDDISISNSNIAIFSTWDNAHTCRSVVEVVVVGGVGVGVHIHCSYDRCISKNAKYVVKGQLRRGVSAQRKTPKMDRWQMGVILADCHGGDGSGSGAILPIVQTIDQSIG